MAKPTKKEEALQAQISELTGDLQRLRADFENYRKRVDIEKSQLSDLAKAATIMKLLPIVDTIERAIAHTPSELVNNQWAKGVTSITKNLEKSLQELGLARIQATPGTDFNPTLHEAVMMDETEGDKQVVAEELRAGYTLSGQVIRPSIVKVTHAQA